MDFKGHRWLAGRDSISAAAMTPLGRLGRRWNQTGLICPQDWRYRLAHLCWEWDPSHDLHQIFITFGQKTRVCVWACGLKAVWVGEAAAGVWTLETVWKPVKGFWVCVGSILNTGWMLRLPSKLELPYFSDPHKKLRGPKESVREHTKVRIS